MASTAISGGCYCGAIRYEAAGDPLMRVECQCRECQHIAGGASNLVMGMPKDGFTYTKGEPAQFARDDLASPRIRDFCATCGTHILTRSPPRPNMVMVKVGTLDDPSMFNKPDMVIYTKDARAWHHVPDDAPSFTDMPS
jgi:hypothetical protein